jgi:negative regulator of sigma E activity
MDNQDKIFNQIKSAAEKAETKDFPSMDKIWNRVEEKLDQKVLKKESKLWKKIAVAASILLLVSLGYQLFKNPENTTNTENEITVKDPLKTPNPSQFDKQNAVVESEITNPIIKKEAAAILEKQISTQNQIVSVERNYTISKTKASDTLEVEEKGSYNTASSAKKLNTWYTAKKFETRSVQQEYDDKSLAKEEVRKNNQEAAKKLDPVLVIDGKISKKTLSNLDEDEAESIIELKEPLYIINSVYYTEKELFGPNPTSPYAPLNKQKVETISILQPEKAVSIYGKKGEKGIVIVTTKDGIPLPKKE